MPAEETEFEVRETPRGVNISSTSLRDTTALYDGSDHAPEGDGVRTRYHASIEVFDEAERFARIYVVDASVCENNWRLTDKALNEIAAGLIGAPLVIGHGAPAVGADVGKFVAHQFDENALYGLLKITDENAWTHIMNGDWNAVSIEFAAQDITCSECGADVTMKPCEHILNRTGHEVIDAAHLFVVSLVETPAYPDARVEEVNGRSVWPYGESSASVTPLITVSSGDAIVGALSIAADAKYTPPWTDFSKRLTAAFKRRVNDRSEEQTAGNITPSGVRGAVGDAHDEERTADKIKGDKKLETEERITELEASIETLKQEGTASAEKLEAANAELEAANKERDELKADAEKKTEEEHTAKVTKLLDLREAAGLLQKADRDAATEKFGTLQGAALDQMIDDAESTGTREASKAKPQTKAGEAKATPVEEARQRLYGYKRDGMASAGGKIVG